MQKNRSGFTLLEMAVVLLLIALVAGGIVIQKSLTRSAEIQAAIREYDVYVKAIKEFQDKYHQLPGDFTAATTIWGLPTTWPGTCPFATHYAIPPDNTGSCPGDGNGRIGASTNAGVLSGSAEWWLMWQHLSNAGLIDGKFSGSIGSSGAASATIGSNVPGSRIKPGGWTVLYMQQVADSGTLYGEPTGGYGHIMVLGTAAVTTYTNGPLLRPLDALDIDSKIDDGKPGTGTVRAFRTGFQANCTTTDTSKTNQTYNVAYGAPACALIFIPGI